MNSTKDGQGREEKQAVQGKKDVLRLFWAQYKYITETLST